MARRRGRMALAGAVAGGAGGCLLALGLGWCAEPRTVEVGQDRHPLAALSTRLLPLHQRKLPPQAGDWLLREEREPGQTFAQYRTVRPEGRRPDRTTLYLQPLGGAAAVPQRLIDDTAAMLRTFYAYPLTVRASLAIVDLPAGSRRQVDGGEQLLTGTLLDRLRQYRPADAVAVLGLTSQDLWPGSGWNFVFGQASLVERIGVWSVHRFGDAEQDYPQVRLRTVKVAVHETGHMFGIRHCIAWECVFNGANSLEESDRGPLWACPECEAKVWHASGCDAAKRYADLAVLARGWGMEGEAVFWERSRAAIAAR